jgi:hypothetical protein
MTRLRPLVVPVAALTLATATPSANAQPRRSVEQWADSPAALAAVHAELPDSHAAPVQPATSLPLADLATHEGEAADPDGRSAVAAPPAAAPATGRQILLCARGPP